MKISCLTMAYNEELIMPYFLKHYENLDEIRVLYETDSNDSTRDILNRPNVKIVDCHIEQGINDIEKAKLINRELSGMDSDWVYVLDTDEFVFPFGNEEAKSFFKRQKDYNVVVAAMYQVYRHKTDLDLNPLLPPIPQRVHGDPDLYSTVQEINRDCNWHYVKPCIVRPGVNFLPGNHETIGEFSTSPDTFTGAHWQMADPSIALHRRLQRKARISPENRKRLMGFQHFNVTADYILEECKRHENDPIIEDLCCVI